jgi:hypothetical protein
MHQAKVKQIIGTIHSDMVREHLYLVTLSSLYQE